VLALNHHSRKFYGDNITESKYHIWITEGNGRQTYRINLDTLEVMKLKFDSDLCVFGLVVHDDFVYISSGDIIQKMDPETGVIIKVFVINDFLENYNSFGYIYDGLFWCIGTGKAYAFNVDSPKKKVATGGMMLSVRRQHYNNPEWDRYCFVDDETIYALDHASNSKLWWIPLDELGDDPSILIADWRGVLVAHGKKISAYGEKKTE